MQTTLSPIVPTYIRPSATAGVDATASWTSTAFFSDPSFMESSRAWPSQLAVRTASPMTEGEQKTRSPVVAAHTLFPLRSKQ